MTTTTATSISELGGEHPDRAHRRGLQAAQDALLPVAGQHRGQRVEGQHGDHERDQDRDVEVEYGEAAQGRLRAG